MNQIKKKLVKKPKFEVFKDVAGEFRFRLVIGNGKIVLSSEGYKNMGGVNKGIASIKKNAPIARIIKIED